MGKEYIGEEEYEESLFDIAGETPFEKARQQLVEAQAAATTGGETTGGESGSTLFQERLGVLSPTTQRERDILLGRHATATAQKVAKKYRPVGRPTHASKGRETKAEQQRRERGEAEAQQLRDMMGGTELPVDLPEGYTPATATKGQIVVQKAGGEPAPPPKPKSPHTEAQQIEQRILQVDTELATGASTGGMSFQAGKSKEELEEERQQLQIELQLKHEQAQPTTLQDVALQHLSQERLGITPKQRVSPERKIPSPEQKQATRRQIKAGKTNIPTYLTPPEPAPDITLELLANQQH